MKQRILAADIGGTSSRFAAFVSESGKLTLEKSTWLNTGEATSFLDLIDRLRKSDFPLKPESAAVFVLAAAGPVERGVYCKPPQISWDIDVSHSERDLGVRDVFLMNDFLAQAYACRSPIYREAEQILPGAVQVDGVVGVVGAGTGFGKASLIPVGGGAYVAAPSEGGHANFAAESPREFEFQEFLVRKLGGKFITWDDVVSGKGLTYLHEFLLGKTIAPSEVAAQFSPTSEVLDWMARLYGRVCRNYALETVALGGLFIAGGLAAKNPQLVRHAAFEKSFRESRMHSDLLSKIAVFLTTNQESGLWGAGFYGFQKLIGS